MRKFFISFFESWAGHFCTQCRSGRKHLTSHACLLQFYTFCQIFAGRVSLHNSWLLIFLYFQYCFLDDLKSRHRHRPATTSVVHIHQPHGLPSTAGGRSLVHRRVQNYLLQRCRDLPSTSPCRQTSNLQRTHEMASVERLRAYLRLEIRKLPLLNKDCRPVVVRWLHYRLHCTKRSS